MTEITASTEGYAFPSAAAKPTVVDRATRLFRSVCVAVPLLACLWLYAQSPGAWPAHQAMLHTYLVIVTSVTTLLLTIYLVLVKFCVRRLRKLPLGRFLPRWHTRYLRTIPLFDTALALGSLIATFATFQLAKSTLVSAGGFRFDALFADLDSLLFLGHDPWQLSHALLPWPVLTQAMDLLYHPTFLPMMAPFVFCVFIRGNKALRQTYMATYLTAWLVIGMVLAQLFASAGPIYDGILWGDGARFGALGARLQAQAAEVGTLYAVLGHDYLLGAHLSGTAATGTGISAMPSMHVALAGMCALAGQAVSRRAGLTLWAYTAVIWIGSFHLGWHYAADGILSLAITCVIWAAFARAFGLTRPARLRGVATGLRTSA